MTERRPPRLSRHVSALIMRRPARVVSVCFIAAMLLFAVVGVRQLYAVREQQLRVRQHDLQLRALGIDGLVVSEQRRLRFLRDYAEQLYSNADARPALLDARDLDDTFAARDNPAWQMPSIHDDAAPLGVGAAQVAAIRGFERADTMLKSDLYVAREMAPLLRLSQQGDRMQGTAVFIAHTGLFVAYPPRSLAEAQQMLQRFSTMPYYRDLLPDRDPDHDAIWTPGYTAYKGDEQLTTLSVPVYFKGAFRGVVALDVVQTHLLALLRETVPPDDSASRDPNGSDYMLLHRNGDLMRFRDGRLTSAPLIHTNLRADFGPITAAQLFAAHAGLLHGKRQYLLFQRIDDGDNWMLLLPVSREELTLEAARRVVSSPLIAAWLALPVLLLITLLIVMHIFDHYVRASERLADLARLDPLTGLANRRELRAVFDHEITRRAREAPDAPLALVSLDIDFFKRVNDTWGHAAGDRVLEALAGVLRANVRAIDTAARLGGEEFAVLMPHTTRAEAAEAGERLRQAVAAMPVEVAAPDGAASGATRTIQVSVSIGVAAAPLDCVADLDRLGEVADRRLYRAKESGRNRVVSDDGPSLARNTADAR